MPADSYIKAVENLIAGLTAGNFPGSAVPAVYFDEAPQANPAGTAQQRAPYIVLEDDGSTYRWDFEDNAIAEGGFTLKCYARTLADADAMLKAVMFNGQNPNQRAGLAMATLSFNAPLYPMAVRPTKGRRGYAGPDYQGHRVHVAEQAFECVVELRGTG